MEVTLKEGFDYIPLWNGNRELPKEKQIVVHMRFQTGAELSDCTYATIDDEGKVVTVVDREKDWSTKCVSVENLKINGKDAQPLDIINVGGLNDLYLELKGKYREETAIDKKK